MALIMEYSYCWASGMGSKMDDVNMCMMVQCVCLLDVCSLTNNSIGKVGGKAIGDALRKNQCLQALE